MISITPVGEVRRRLEKRPAKTRTYRVRADVVAKVAGKPSSDQRRMSKAEVAELAEYLGIAPGRLQGPFVVPDASCPRCGRRVTFLDFVHTGVKLKAHSKDQLRDVLTGRGGAWLTIRGADGGRPIVCFGCQRPVGLASYCYMTGSYAYA